MIGALFALCVVATFPAGLRWLRIAQREHYIPGSVLRFRNRWVGLGGVANGILVAIQIAATLFTIFTGSVWSAGLVAVTVGLEPIGMGIRGSSSPLAWTPRLIRVAVVWGLILGSALVAGLINDLPVVLAIAMLVSPGLLDVALLILKPIERSLGSKWVHKARRKLAAVRPEIVAITGSYGKTTTKGYVTHLLSGSMRVVPTPASFNNRMGLARAINENLTPGTQVFVAEMGTYGKGEIADLCSWVTPKVAAIVSIGPVHLERFKTEERIVEAKSEILDRSEVGVICVDHPLLADLASARSSTMSVIEVGTGDRGRVRVVDGEVMVDGVRTGSVPEDVYPQNLAVAIGICLAMGMETGDIAARFGDLPRAEHRLTPSISASGGFNILDDTFNSNPAGARMAIETLAATGSGRKVLVTPGMVELGPIQAQANHDLAAHASAVVDDIIIVGRTNRSALTRGADSGRAAVTVVDTREDAVGWVRENLGPGDAVLYENDLPDHYP